MRPATLQLLMRHASIDTTLRFYVALGADDVAGELWAAVGNSSGNTPSNGATSGRQETPETAVKKLPERNPLRNNTLFCDFRKCF